MTSEPRPAARPELSDAAVVSRSWGMAFATLISRITGFFRIQLLALTLGGAMASSFTVANQLPNLVAALVLEATFTAIFIPVLARAEREDADGGAAFIRRLVTLATAVLAVATIISVAAAPLLVRLMLGSDPEVDEPLTRAFAYLLLPQVIFYGLTSVFMAILNTRNHFAAPAWAPVVNNVVAIATIGAFVLVPGEFSADLEVMGRAKLLVLGIGTTLGVVAQAAVLLIAIRRERVSLRPLWGIDDRLKKFGSMAAAMVLYVLISQVGLVVGNQIASGAADSGPAIYNFAWLVLQLPFGVIGVTVLTVVMPRLSRNAAAENTPAVLADLSLATRLTMITLIPVVAVTTVAGPAIGSALFAYGNFGDVDANYLGIALTLSAFTLIPYTLVLLYLRVFYARQQPWIPILIIVVITTVKIVASLAAPHVTDNPEMVAGYLGAANGLGFAAGAVAGAILLRRTLNPPGGRLLDASVRRTVAVTFGASLLAAGLGYLADRGLGLAGLTLRHGGMGSLVRLLILASVILLVVAAVLFVARVPEARSALAMVQRRLGRTPTDAGDAPVTPDSSTTPVAVPYAEPSDQPSTRMPEAGGWPADGAQTKGPAVSDEPSVRGDAPPPLGVPVRGEPSNSGSEPTLAATPVTRPSTPSAVPLTPGATIAGGRYRLLVFHGGPPPLQFWQALDTALDRQVALTFIDPDGTLSGETLRDILTRTSRLSRIEHAGIARVLDVTRFGSGGLVVAEWIRGGSLREVAETSPSPIGGARAVQSLAAAADVAHKAGVALSIDHPSRIRVSIDGDVALAFPATLPEATPEDDIRGIGAALYALLVNRWPLPETGTPSGMSAADTDAVGQPLEPRTVDRSVPFQISAAATRSVQVGGGIRTAPTLLNLLQQATALVDRTESLDPVQSSSAGAVTDTTRADATRDALARHRRTLMIGLGVGAAILVVALIVLASVLGRIFGDVGGGIDGDQLGLSPQTTSTAPADGAAVKPVAATVFSPDGGADAPSLARLAIDGDAETVWPTDTYTDNNPFPNFKNGVGLMLQLPEPAKIGSVDIGVTSTGTRIQIRSATTAEPSSLEDTVALTEPALMKTGDNTIEVNSEESTSYVLVWISTLGTVDGKNRSDITDVTVHSAS